MSVVATDGWLRLYNIWDSGRGLGPFESQSYTSGMLVTRQGDWLRYGCADIDAPQFDRLTFLLRLGAA